MEIRIKRFAKGKDYTVGWLYINGEHVCDTLEDVVRDLPDECPNTPRWIGCKCKEKIYGETAIPAGEYWGRVSFSPKFKRYLVEIMDVPHFLGIRIHNGVHKDHTEGCILVGEYVENSGRLSNSKASLEKLHNIIKDNIGSFNEKGGKFKIKIE